MNPCVPMPQEDHPELDDEAPDDEPALEDTEPLPATPLELLVEPDDAPAEHEVTPDPTEDWPDLWLFVPGWPGGFGLGQKPKEVAPLGPQGESVWRYA